MPLNFERTIEKFNYNPVRIKFFGNMHIVYNCNDCNKECQTRYERFLEGTGICSSCRTIKRNKAARKYNFYPGDNLAHCQIVNSYCDIIDKEEYFICICECQKIFTTNYTALTKEPSCGCLQKETIRQMRLKRSQDACVLGGVYGYLKILKLPYLVPNMKKSLVDCLCLLCGTECTIPTRQIIYPHSTTKSCGCLNRENRHQYAVTHFGIHYNGTMFKSSFEVLLQMVLEIFNIDKYYTYEKPYILQNNKEYWPDFTLIDADKKNELPYIIEVKDSLINPRNPDSLLKPKEVAKSGKWVTLIDEKLLNTLLLPRKSLVYVFSPALYRSFTRVKVNDCVRVDLNKDKETVEKLKSMINTKDLINTFNYCLNQSTLPNSHHIAPYTY